jgi:SulP family sulfate permease
VDLTDVDHLGVSSALALEEAILDMARAGRPVYLSGARDQTLQRLQKLDVFRYVPRENNVSSRRTALEKVLYGKTAPLVEQDEEST